MESNRFLNLYLLNVILSFVLVVLKIELNLNCSWWFCLAPVIIINLIMFIIMLCILKYLLKEKEGKTDGN